MTMVIVGKADRNWTIEEAQGKCARNGSRYIDLATGDLIALVKEAPIGSASVDMETGESGTVKKKKKRK